MLPRACRLKSAAVFKAALLQKRFFAGPFFVVYGLARLPQSSEAPLAQPPLQFGLIISKKTEKRAVGRNRVKRRMRELLRTIILPQLASQYSQRYRAFVIIMRPPSVTAGFDELKAACERCFLGLPSLRNVST